MNINKFVVAAAFVIVGYMSIVVWAGTLPKLPKPTQDKVVETELGTPVIAGVDKDGKPILIVIKELIMTVRSDGTLGWKLSPEFAKQFEEEAKKGIKLPPPDYNTGKR